MSESGKVCVSVMVYLDVGLHQHGYVCCGNKAVVCQFAETCFSSNEALKTSLVSIAVFVSNADLGMTSSVHL